MDTILEKMILAKSPAFVVLAAEKDFLNQRELSSTGKKKEESILNCGSYCALEYLCEGQQYC